MKANLLAALAAIAIQLPLFGILSIAPLAGTGTAFDGGDIAFYTAAVLIVAGTTVFLVGLPVFVLLKNAGRADMKTVAIAGFIIGALPVAALGWPLSGLYAGYSSSAAWFGHAVDFYKNGSPTLYAWLDYALNVARVGIHGLVGGAVFFLTWRKAG